MRLKGFLGFREFELLKKMFDFSVCGQTPSGVIVRPKKSFCLTPKFHLTIESLGTAFLIHSKTVLMLMQSWVESFAILPMSLTYCANWSTLKAVSRYSLIKDEKADKKRLRP